MIQVKRVLKNKKIEFFRKKINFLQYTILKLII